jgi:hypothetical protein
MRARYSITSSARTSNAVGVSIPGPFAVLRFEGQFDARRPLDRQMAV